MQSVKKILFCSFVSSMMAFMVFSSVPNVVFAANNLNDEEIGGALSSYYTAKNATPSNPSYQEYQRYLAGTDKIIADGKAKAAKIRALCNGKDAASVRRANQLSTDLEDATERQAAFTYEANRLKALSTLNPNTVSVGGFGGIGVNSNSNASFQPYIDSAQKQADLAKAVAAEYEAGCYQDLGDTATADTIRKAGAADLKRDLQMIQLTPYVQQTAACAHGGTGFIQSGYYCMLTGLGNFFPNNEINIRTGTAHYLDTLYKIGVSVATGLALIFITIGGVQYASTDSFTGSSEGKKKIWSALSGLAVVLGSYIMLNAINPDLLTNNLSLSPVDQFKKGIDSGAPTEGTPAGLGARTAEEHTLASQTWNGVTPNTDYIPELGPDGSMSIRSTFYNPDEAGADGDTKALRSATGVPLRYADSNTVGVVAVDPAVVPYGSVVKVNTANGPLYYIAADTGTDVKSRKASNGTAPVFDFFSKSQVGGENISVSVQPYTGSTPFNKLDAATQAQFFDRGLYQ
jgi:3D (Asp-Asp-Asp) domain-containing protein